MGATWTRPQGTAMSYELSEDTMESIDAAAKEWACNGFDDRDYELVITQAFTEHLQSHPEELARFCDAVLERVDAYPHSQEFIEGPDLYRIPNSGEQSK